MSIAVKGKIKRMFWFGSIIVVLALVSLHFWSASQFKKHINNAIGDLKAGVSDGPVDIKAIPALISNFAERAATGQRATPNVIHVRQHGEIRMQPDAKWQSFSADQYFSVYEPGFIWLAKAKIAPLMNVVVVDSYVKGEGYLTARLFGSLPLASATGSELDRGELMRYIAELVWNPAAIVNNPQLQFTMADNNTVSISIGQTNVNLFFDDQGDIVRIYAPDRPRTVGKDSAPTAWEGRFFDYTQVGPYRLPKGGEVIDIEPVKM
jgi:hypothetical protein